MNVIDSEMDLIVGNAVLCSKPYLFKETFENRTYNQLFSPQNCLVLNILSEVKYHPELAVEETLEN